MTTKTVNIGVLSPPAFLPARIRNISRPLQSQQVQEEGRSTGTGSKYAEFKCNGEGFMREAGKFNGRNSARMADALSDARDEFFRAKKEASDGMETAIICFKIADADAGIAMIMDSGIRGFLKSGKTVGMDVPHVLNELYMVLREATRNFGEAVEICKSGQLEIELDRVEVVLKKIETAAESARKVYEAHYEKGVNGVALYREIGEMATLCREKFGKLKSALLAPDYS